MNIEKIIIGEDSWGRPKRVLSEVGKHYGRLTVLSLAPYEEKYRVHRWVCKCECGNITKIRGTSLRNNTSTSCGCYWESIRILGCHRLPKNEAAFNRIYEKIRWGATKRKLVFELDKSVVKKLISMECHYCGCPPNNFHKEKYGSIKWNGLDQRYPGIGYTIENCVPCCYPCNRMKLNIPYNEFLNKINKIYKNIAKGR